MAEGEGRGVEGVCPGCSRILDVTVRILQEILGIAAEEF